MKQADADRSITCESADNVSATERFLLIKAWGGGFWWEMEHVIWQLLLAEVTGRISVVYWGNNSLYGGSEEVNAFEQFFLPVSDYAIQNLIREDYTFFPNTWNFANLFDEDPHKFTRPWYFETLLARDENVLVSDSWFASYLTLAFLPYTHPAYGFSLQETYRYIYSKYIALQSCIAEEIDAFHDAHMRNRHLLAVHVRGSDKVLEVDKLQQINKLYAAEIENYLARYPSALLFVLTESETILAEYKSIFKERMIYTDCQRTSGDKPIFDQATDKRRMGIEVLKDVYLATRCDTFVGNAHSNVSNAVARLKAWPADSVKLFSVHDLP